MVPIYALVRLSTTPITRPPTMAPGMEPMPPSTAATKAFRPSMAPIIGETCGYETQYISEATAARPEPMAKVRVMVEFTLMPIRIEASLSSETARMALPCLVYVTNSCSATMMTKPNSTVRMVAPSILSPPSAKVGIWMTVGTV